MSMIRRARAMPRRYWRRETRPLAAPDRRARSAGRLRRDLPHPRRARVSLGSAAVARARALPDLRRAEHRRTAVADARVRGAHAQALRRHRAPARRHRRARLPAADRPRGDPADEPDARRLRDRQRRPALRALDLRRGADALAGALRLAAAERGRAGGEHELLPRARPPHEHQGRAGDLRRLRRAARRLRGRALRVLAGRARSGRRDPRAARGLLSLPASSARHLDCTARRAVARRLPLSRADAVRAGARGRRPARPRAPAAPAARAPRSRRVAGAARVRHLPGRLSRPGARDVPRVRPARELLAEGRAAAPPLGRSAFCARHGVRSEADYKRARRDKGELTWHAHIGLSDWASTSAALEEIAGAVALDRFGLCLSRSMSLPAERRASAAKETGPRLEPSDWAQV